MVKALIHGTRICELVDDDKTFEVHSDLKWVDVPDSTTTFDTYVDSKVVKYVEPVISWDENRRRSYPVIGDQLDALYHAGVFPDDMAAQIKAVKDKYPKPD